MEILWIQPLELPQRMKHTIIQNSAVGVEVEFTMNWDQGSETKLGKTTPKHNSTSAELNCGNNAFWQEASPGRYQNQALLSKRRTVNLESSLQRTCLH